MPLERGADLEPQSQALWGGPLTLASRLAADAADAADAVDAAGEAAAAAAETETLLGCTRALAAADYLSKAILGYRREARVGRVPFAVDELLAAGIENDDLVADPPPPRLQTYLDGLREQAVRYFESAAQRLPQGQRERHRHLLVLAAIGRAHLKSRVQPEERRRWKDMLLAWTTARRAH